MDTNQALRLQKGSFQKGSSKGNCFSGLSPVSTAFLMCGDISSNASWSHKVREISARGCPLEKPCQV